MTPFKALFLSFALFLLMSSVYTHADDYACNHDDEDHEPADDLDVEEDMSSLNAGRVLASEEYPKMRIYPYYGLLEDAPSSYQTYLENELIPPVVDFLSAALHVKYPISGKLKSSSSSVCSQKNPSVLKNGVEADLFYFFDHKSEDSSTVASSRQCTTASGTKRPIIGYTIFNRQMLKEAKGDVLLHEKNMYLVIHEMMHALGVSKNAYGNYIDDNGKRRSGHIKTKTIAGKSHTVIDIPALTERLKNFYGCSTIPGAIMENDGGSGTAKSHFERKFFVYETMASGGIYGRRVTEFSLGMLEGSGWYAPDYNYAEPYFFGKGEGCDFINEKCSSSKAAFDEFCTGSSRGCAPQGRSGGKCSSDSKANGCKYVDPDTDYDCENPDGEDNARLPELQVYGRGAESKCFTGTLNSRKSSSSSSKTTFCFKYECSGEGADTELYVKVGSNKVKCDKAGSKTIDGYYGSIDCPDPLTFCEGAGKRYCQRGCMGRGKCVDGRCECDNGFTGVDCSYRA